MRCIMIFFDTNVLIYMSIDQSQRKQSVSQSLIRDAIDKEEFFISPLVFSEYVYTLSKLKILGEQASKVEMFSRFILFTIDKEILIEAYKLCECLNFCKNINDIIHLKIAEQHCSKLVTFDSDFKKLQKHTNINIEIIK